MPKFEDPNLLVGFDTSDDACVYRITDEVAMVQTVDFFPPMVDDPYMFGQIAAANSLSDVYAMGGVPKLAMNLLCYPNCLPPSAVNAILAGGADKVMEAGAVLAGGHTIQDNEPKYGLCVSGFVNPSKILSNANAQPGDCLILTKPIGIGVMNTAAKADMITQEEFRPAMESMAALNKAPAELLKGLDVHSCTDITGFGLLGHACEMAQGSGTTIQLLAEKVPYFPQAAEMAKMGILPAGVYNNYEYLDGKINFSETVPRYLRDLLADPQTSGGLLISLPYTQAEKILPQLRDVAPDSAIVGEVVEKGLFPVQVK